MLSITNKLTLCLHFRSALFGVYRLLNIFAYAKIDSRTIDARRPPLEAFHRTITIHAAVLARTVIGAADVTIREDVAAEIGGTAVHIGRVNIATNI